MIHWLWLIPTFFAGGTLGIIILAACALAKRADNAMDGADTYIYKMETGDWDTP